MADTSKPRPTPVTRQQAILNEAVRLVTVEGYEPSPAIITACETVSASPQARHMARMLWLVLVNRVRKEIAK